MSRKSSRSAHRSFMIAVTRSADCGFRGDGVVSIRTARMNSPRICKQTRAGKISGANA